MNQVYRNVWNATLNTWVAASELARGHGRAQSALRIARRAVLTTGMVMAPLFTAWADTDITVPTSYTPANFKDSSGNPLVLYLINDGGTTNLNGTIKFTGSSWTQLISSTLAGLYNLGYVVPGATSPWPISSANTPVVALGTKNQGVDALDVITQGKTVVNTYNSANFTQGVAGQSLWISVYSPTTGTNGPFVAANLAEVSNKSTLNINANGTIGDGTTRQSTFFKVTDGEINWNSTNKVVFVQVGQVVTPAQLAPQTQTVTITTYTGNFTVTDIFGNVYQQSVTNLAELQAYNDWLIDQLKAGKLGSGSAAPTNYDNALALAYSNKSVTYTINKTNGSIAADDPMFIDGGNQIALLADGKNAKGNVNGKIVADWSSSTGTTLLRAKNGATITIADTGVVNSVRNVMGMGADGGSHLIINGVRNVGDAGDGVVGEVKADWISTAGTTLVNNGIVNVYLYNYAASGSGAGTSLWLDIYSNAVATNNGTINVGVNVPQASPVGVGVQVRSDAQFTNTSGAMIYLGRAPSEDVALLPEDRGGADVAQPNGDIGIKVLAGGKAVNNGTIVIGDKVQKGWGIWASGANSTTSVINNGTIEVNGHYNDTPLANVGLYSTATAGTINNAGTIDVSGVNAIGIQALSGGKAASSGTINVDGAVTANGLRSYGIWAEGSGSAVGLSEAVNLTGEGAIGVHARDGGQVAVSGAGVVNFSAGTHQIGYYLYGPGATITTNGTASQAVTTEDSTLFRIGGGASYAGVAGAGGAVTASGQGSKGIVATGTSGGIVSSYNSNGMTLALAGPDTIGVLVDGGAQGKISSSANIQITNAAAAGSIVGVVDGQAHDLDGSTIGTPIAGVLADASKAAGAAGFGSGTLLVTQAALNSTVDEVTGYVARHGGMLSNSGAFTLSGTDSVGLLVEAGSRIDNSGKLVLSGEDSYG
ncbi:ESPR domain-containing protein, partial [Chitiniphilus shinanonensis]|uniref:ESPR domain-containing protein n=2 Tax=Chitiniphilus shinanonensis TaxID=553088 RepID=UPI0024E093B2